MNRPEEGTEIVKDDIYPFHIQQSTNGWANAGFQRRLTDIKVRFAEQHDPPQVQFEIAIHEYKASGREYQHSGSFTLTPEEAAQLVVVLSRTATGGFPDDR